MRILDFNVEYDEPGNRYNDQLSSKAVRTFAIVFKIHCENCGRGDFVTVSSRGWQAGKHSDAIDATGGAFSKGAPNP